MRKRKFKMHITDSEEREYWHKKGRTTEEIKMLFRSSTNLFLAESKGSWKMTNFFARGVK